MVALGLFLRLFLDILTHFYRLLLRQSQHRSSLLFNYQDLLETYNLLVILLTVRNTLMDSVGIDSFPLDLLTLSWLLLETKRSSQKGYLILETLRDLRGILKQEKYAFDKLDVYIEGTTK